MIVHARGVFTTAAASSERPGDFRGSTHSSFSHRPTRVSLGRAAFDGERTDRVVYVVAFFIFFFFLYLLFRSEPIYAVSRVSPW